MVIACNKDGRDVNTARGALTVKYLATSSSRYRKKKIIIIIIIITKKNNNKKNCKKAEKPKNNAFRTEFVIVKAKNR